MNRPLYKQDDLVTCVDSEELVQPLKVLGLHPWCKPLDTQNGKLYVYHVTGTHRKKGNELTITLLENQMTKE